MAGTDASRGADESVGRRIARKRRVRGLTQYGLAERAHISRSLIEKVESGTRPATPSLVAAVASALHVDPAEIYGQPYRGADARADRVHAAISEVRRAIACVDLPPEMDTPPRPLDDLVTEVTKLRRLSQAGRDVQVSVRIPAVLTELSVHAYEIENPRAWEPLNAAHAIAASLTRHLGYYDLTALGLERAASAAAHSGDPNLPRLAQLSRALLLMTIGAWDQGLGLVHRAGDGMDQDTASSRAVHGALHLRAAILSARAGDAGDAWEHHGVAYDTVRRLPARSPDFYGLQFNAPNVDIHGAAVAVELGDFDEAIRRDGRLTLPPQLTSERRAHHEIDLSRALVSTSRYDRALRRVVQAERTAPQMTWYHPMARETVRHLVDHYRRLPEALRSLQNRMDL